MIYTTKYKDKVTIYYGYGQEYQYIQIKVDSGKRHVFCMPYLETRMADRLSHEEILRRAIENCLDEIKYIKRIKIGLGSFHYNETEITVTPKDDLFKTILEDLRKEQCIQ